VGWVGGSSNLTPGGPQHAFLWYGGGPLQGHGTLGGPNSGADGPNWFGEAPIISEIAQKDPDGEDFCGYGTHLQCRGAIWRFGRLKGPSRSAGRPQFYSSGYQQPRPVSRVG
jgi:hypothetical protein